MCHILHRSFLFFISFFSLWRKEKETGQKHCRTQGDFSRTIGEQYLGNKGPVTLPTIVVLGQKVRSNLVSIVQFFVLIPNLASDSYKMK